MSSPHMPQFSPKATTGPIHGVKCPHCGTPMDLRAIKETMRTLDTKSFVSCDQCERVSQIVAVQQVVVVKLRQAPGKRGDGKNGGPPIPPPGTRRGG